MPAFHSPSLPLPAAFPSRSPPLQLHPNRSIFSSAAIRSQPRNRFIKNEEAKVSREKAAKESKFLGLEKREQP
ncbi:hypothetical protein OIU79_002037 [Salix purpurea]|uniref:Uncharacterized protein n=1 Tax=Salix purpurea TaxID=77065 RepID=A0A9Q0URL4_SALPP|nr:hypothetical protein OIU79_002037 [Salix purpurea]